MATADEFLAVVEASGSTLNFELTYAIQDYCLCFVRVDEAGFKKKRGYPTLHPTPVPTLIPTPLPSLIPTLIPTPVPTLIPTPVPTPVPSLIPTPVPTLPMNCANLGYSTDGTYT